MRRRGVHGGYGEAEGRELAPKKRGPKPKPREEEEENGQLKIFLMEEEPISESVKVPTGV
jgi:hypothetical protein